MMSKKIMYAPIEANQLVSEGAALLIDVRDREDYKKGHIPGAVNLPEMLYILSMTTPEGLMDMRDTFRSLFSEAGISKNKKVIVYEDKLDTRYGGSCRGYFQLTYLGHPDVGILDGGFTQWKKDGFPVTKETVKSDPVEFNVAIEEGMLVTMNEMLRALNNSSIKVLDTRDEIEWTGESSSPYGKDFAPRKGRIPGARWIEWYDFMEEKDMPIAHFKSPEKIKSMCAKVGIQPEDEIIVYCFKGARAANTYVALKMAGFENVRNYYGSWNEWSREPNLPINSDVLVAEGMR